MEDFHTVVSLILLERRLFLVILHDNVVAVLRFRSRADNESFAFLELWSERGERIRKSLLTLRDEPNCFRGAQLRLHGIAFHMQREVVLALHVGLDPLDYIFLKEHLACFGPPAGSHPGNDRDLPHLAD